MFIATVHRRQYSRKAVRFCLLHTEDKEGVRLYMEERGKKTRKILAAVMLVVLICIFAGCVLMVRWTDQRDREAMSGSTEDKKEETDEAQEEPGGEEDGGKKTQEQKKEELLPTKIVFTGDVMLKDQIIRNYNSKGILGVVDQTLLDLTVGADITMINNEFAFSTRGTPADKQYTFRVDPKYVSAISELGTDVAGLANNHVLDYGKDALEDTFATFEQTGIAYTGAGRTYEDACRLIKFEKNGKTFGFLAASRVIPVVSWNVENSAPGVFCTYDTTHLVEEIVKAKQQCDYVFVAVHWGTERTDVLTDYQPVMAHKFIDAGADAVIGAHPHVLQGIEMYRGKPIFYSLGNYIFARTINRTMAVELTVTPEDQMNIRIIPASCENFYTHAMDAQRAAEVYRYLNDLSSTITIDENGMVYAK